MTRPLIDLVEVRKHYGTGDGAFHALRGVSLSLASGDFMAVMGASGSGKSTTMNIVGCLDRPTEGSYLFDGVAIERLDAEEHALFRRKYVGFVFQSFNLLARSNALDNVALPLLYRGEKRSRRRELAMAALDQVGLADRWRSRPAQLSGGQQQRIAIARAIVTSPRLLLADEPTGNLDSARSAEIMELLADLNRSRGITIMIVTHDAVMARYARSTAHFTDGLVEKVERVDA